MRRFRPYSNLISFNLFFDRFRRPSLVSRGAVRALVCGCCSWRLIVLRLCCRCFDTSVGNSYGCCSAMIDVSQVDYLIHRYRCLVTLMMIVVSVDDLRFFRWQTFRWMIENGVHNERCFRCWRCTKLAGWLSCCWIYIYRILFSDVFGALTYYVTVGVVPLGCFQTSRYMGSILVCLYGRTWLAK